MSEKEIYKKVGQFSIVKSGENSASIDMRLRNIASVLRLRKKREKKDREYQRRPEVKERRREYYQRPEVKERQKERQKMNKIGNVDNIRALCLKHGFSEEAADVIAVDGELLDKKLKELEK